MTATDQNHGSRLGCAACSLMQLCLPAGLDAQALAGAEELRKFRVARGACLYRVGQPLRSIYAIRVGFMKSRLLRTDGREQVTGFHMRGEVVGLDAIGTERHLCDAVALEDCEVCEMPFSTVEELCSSMPALQRHVRRILGQEIASNRSALIMLSGTRSDQRVAAFLLDLSGRLAERGYSPREFELRMTREEIGSYLGLQIETVSRVLSQFQKQRIIEVRRRLIRIVGMTGLSELAGRAQCRPPADQGPGSQCPWHRS